MRRIGAANCVVVERGDNKMRTFRLTVAGIVAGVFAILSAAAWADKHAKIPQCCDERPMPRSLAELYPKAKQEVLLVKKQYLDVEDPNSHLEQDQTLKVIGPISSGQGTKFVIVPVVKNPGAPPHTWMPDSYDAELSLVIPAPGLTPIAIYNIDDVRVWAPGEPGHPTPPPTDHVCAAQINFDAQGATEMWLQCNKHNGTLGDHGGSAHLKR